MPVVQFSRDYMLPALENASEVFGSKRQIVNVKSCAGVKSNAAV